MRAIAPRAERRAESAAPPSAASLPRRRIGRRAGAARGQRGVAAPGVDRPELALRRRDAAAGKGRAEDEIGAVCAAPERRMPESAVRRCADEAAAQSFEDFVKRYEKQAWRLIEALLKRCNATPQQCA